VVEQMSHLQQLQEASVSRVLQQSGAKAIRFCDGKALEYYEELKKRKDSPGDYAPSSLVIHYLYMRSLNTQVPLDDRYQEMHDFWWKQAAQYWLQTSLFNQALLALAAHNTKQNELTQRIYTSLQERSLQSEELGRYWKYNNGYYWYQLPIETHVKLMELYQTMNAPEEELAELKIWLLRNKETNRWETTKATAAAVYALMSTGEDWLGETTPLKVTFPDLPVKMYVDKLADAQANAEAGTGSYQVRWDAEEVQTEMGQVRLKNSSQVPGWGALYWQRFATIDEVERDGDNPLKIERQLYRKTNQGDGDILEPLTDAPAPGDLITVRLVIRTDRDMEFVHLKDLRASGLEPVDQLSGYRYQSALGYYQQTTDLGTHFFFDSLRKGEYVLEYNLRVFHAGDFSGGLASLQCMYAPKFVSHSEGRRLKVFRSEE
ncbi:MAG: alpha-2-macroglobulin, partial [Bacteroidota bacterium]